MDEIVRFSCSMPRSLVDSMDETAEALGVSRSALLNMVMSAAMGGSMAPILKAAEKAAKKAKQVEKLTQEGNAYA